MKRILIPSAIILILLNFKALSQTCPQLSVGSSSGGTVNSSFFELNDTLVVSGEKIFCSGVISTDVNGSWDYTQKFYGTINPKMKLKIKELKSGDKVHFDIKHRVKGTGIICASTLTFIIK